MKMTGDCKEQTKTIQEFMSWISPALEQYFDEFGYEYSNENKKWRAYVKKGKDKISTQWQG